MLDRPINIELCIGEHDVVHSYSSVVVPCNGELIHTYTEEKNSKRSFLIVDRQWYCFPHQLGVVLTVVELDDAGVANLVDAQE